MRSCLRTYDIFVLQLLIGVVDAQLLKCIHVKRFKTKDVQETHVPQGTRGLILRLLMHRKFVDSMDNEIEDPRVNLFR